MRPERLDQRVEVEHRLAEAHDDEIGELPFVSELGACTRELLDHLVAAQIAPDAAESRGAEDACDRAANLGAHAERRAFAFGDEHHLDVLAVIQAQQQLGGARRSSLRG
jgi:hypothetical protein